MLETILNGHIRQEVQTMLRCICSWTSFLIMCSVVIISLLHINICSLVLLLILYSCCWFPSWTFLIISSSNTPAVTGSDHRGRKITQNWNLKNQKLSKVFHCCFYLNMLNWTETSSVKSEFCSVSTLWRKEEAELISWNFLCFYREPTIHQTSTPLLRPRICCSLRPDELMKRRKRWSSNGLKQDVLKQKKKNRMNE